MGHWVLASGIHPLPGHMEAVIQFPCPLSRLELQCFLGLVNFYHRFLRGAAGFLLPLTDTLQGPGKTLAWSPPMGQAFNAAKTALAAAAKLEHPQADFPISLMVDTSGTHNTVLSYNTFVVRLGLLSPSSRRSCRRLRPATGVRQGVFGCQLHKLPLLPDAGRPPVFRPHRPQASLPHLGPAFCSVVCPTAAAFGVHL